MSFGFSVGDILATLNLADELKKRFFQAPKEFRAISDEYDNRLFKIYFSRVEIARMDITNTTELK